MDGLTGIERIPGFLPTEHPGGVGEALTLARESFRDFRSIEGNPHGPAHSKAAGTGGWLAKEGTAVRDPLFFLLHANVDRLWALWQVEKGRFDPSSVLAYWPQGSSTSCGALGHAADDTMWPWNGATHPADPCRPPTAPGGAFPALAPGLFVPPQQPRPRDLIDYRTSPASPGGTGFSYADVPFNPPPPKASS
jgi:tyrosinase